MLIPHSAVVFIALLFRETCQNRHPLIMKSCSDLPLSLSLCSSGNLSKTCTMHGWPSSSLDSYIMDCGYNPNNTVEEDSVSLAICFWCEFKKTSKWLAWVWYDLVTGRILHHHQSRLHSRTQRFPYFTDDCHHHTVFVSVRIILKKNTYPFFCFFSSFRAEVFKLFKDGKSRISSLSATFRPHFDCGRTRLT